LIAVAVLALMPAAEPPKLTLAPERLVPVMLTRVPPASGPADGEMPVITGTAAVTVIPVETVSPSTVAETVLVPAVDGVNVVVPAPDEKKLPVGTTFPVPPVTANVAGMTSGTKTPPPAVFVPTELTVRFARTAEVWAVVMDAGDAAMLSRRYGLVVRAPKVDPAAGPLFEPHQLFAASTVEGIPSESQYTWYPVP
jgi:hypothetical protein